MPASMELQGKRVLLTGATGGLGEAIARALSERGADLVLSGRRADALAALAQELGAETVVCDLADRDDLERLVAAAGDVDVLVANAGLPGSGTLQRMEPEEIDRVLEVNLRAPIMLARRLLPGMIERSQRPARVRRVVRREAAVRRRKLDLHGHQVRAARLCARPARPAEAQGRGRLARHAGARSRRRHVRARRRQDSAVHHRVVARGRRRRRWCARSSTTSPRWTWPRWACA